MATTTDQSSEIFNQLLKKAKEKFKQSSLSKSKWGLSLCATPIQMGKPIIMGINWGGGSIGDKNEYKIQEKMPSESDFQKELKNGNYKFLTRSKQLLEKHRQLRIDDDEFNYTNLCLFRTPKASELPDDAMDSCIEILQEFIKKIEPDWILSFGKSNVITLGKTKALIENNQNSSTLSKFWFSGKLWGYKFYSLPHPNARLKNEYRNSIWKNVFSCK